MINYLIITVIVICLLVIIKVLWTFIESKRKPKSVMDKLMEEPKYREMKEFYDVLHAFNKGGTDQDTIPEGIGEFGYYVTNPIPVNTVFGNTAYLGRLRTLNDIKVTYERLGSTGAKNINHPIDIYAIYEEDKKIATLYISPYNKKNSTIAPKGFKLAELP